MDNERSVPGCLVVLGTIVALAFATLALGCGSTPQENAHRTVTVIAEAVDVTDIAFAQVYTARAAEALAASESLDAYRSALAPLDAVVTSLRTLRSALEIGDAVIRIWDQGGVSSWPQAFACIVGGLVGLRNVLVAAGVQLPPELTAVVEMTRGLANPDSCFADAGVPGGA